MVQSYKFNRLVLMAIILVSLATIPFFAGKFPDFPLAHRFAAAADYPLMAYPPPPSMPQCQDKQPTIDSHRNAVIQQTDTDYNAVLKAPDGSVLVKIRANMTIEKGERLLVPKVDRMVSGGDDGLSTVAMYAYMHTIGPVIMRDFGITTLRIVWITLQGYRWDCLKALMGHQVTDVMTIDEIVADFFRVSLP